MAGDYIVRALARQGRVRAFAIHATKLVEELRRRNDTWPVASAALGRTAAAGAMMGAMLKGNERLTVIIKGGGPIGSIVVDANAKGEVRGMVTNPHLEFPLNEKGKLDVRRAVGVDGSLIVTKDLGLRDPYNGSSELVSGEIGEDFTYYFAMSEQTPSAVSVGVLVNPDYSILAAGGFILQLLPGIKDEEIEEIEQTLATIPAVSQLIEQGLTPEQILQRVLGEDVEILGTIPVVFNCHCSDERVENAIISLGPEEVQSIIDEQGEAEITCHFCSEKYQVKREQLERIRDQIR